MAGVVVTADTQSVTSDRQRQRGLAVLAQLLFLDWKIESVIHRGRRSIGLCVRLFSLLGSRQISVGRFSDKVFSDTLVLIHLLWKSDVGV